MFAVSPAAHYTSQCHCASEGKLLIRYSSKAWHGDKLEPGIASSRLQIGVVYVEGFSGS